MLRFLLIYVWCSIAYCGTAQLSIGYQQDVLPLHDLPVHAMPSVDNEELLHIEYRNHQNDRPVHFAHPFSVDINPGQSDAWEYVGNTAIWRGVIESKTAHSLNLGFSEFYLPQGGRLYVYDYYNSAPSSPFTAADNEAHEQLWTPIIASDKIVIEINIPIKKKEQLRLQLAYVNHDFLDIRKSSTKSCHIDVNCAAKNGHPEIEEFRNQIRSVGLFTLSGKSVCSGFLINNTRQDCTPYFMTAFHCNLNQSNAPSMVTYWNYEHSECREPGSQESAQQGDGRFDTFNSGATWRAGWADSDFTLVEFDDEVPESAKAYFAGWDINNNPPDRAVLIHHPNLEEKRISFADANLFTGLWGMEITPVVNGNHLVLSQWDQGSTEGGSSGAPLFNRQGLVVGQLHGGLASCDNQAYDAFGRLFSSWTGGNTSRTRLKDWLDPDGTGRVQLPGKNCIFDVVLSDNNIQRCHTDGFFTLEIQVDDSFLGQVNLSIEGLPNGANAFFSNNIVSAGQITTLTVSNINNLATGEYTLEILADNGQHSRLETLFFEINTEAPAQAILLSPAMDETLGFQDLTFDWLPQANADRFEFQLSENENLFPLLLETTIDEASLDLNFPLMANQTYYWRVRAINTCGPSLWSPTFRFNTVDLTCHELVNAESQAIDNEETSTIFSIIQNDVRGIVQSVVIKNINGEHSFISDLRFSLISPAGTEVLLMNRKCSSNEDFDLGFSDEGVSEIICPPTDGQLYKSEAPLANFVGESAHGEWTLKVEDLNKFDGGILNGWAIEICANPSIDFSISTDVDSLEICTSESISLPFRLGAGYEVSTDIIFESNQEVFVSVQYLDGVGNLIVNPSEMAIPGAYPLEILVSDESDNRALLQLYVNVIDAPSDFVLQQPAANASQVALRPSFSWSLSEYAGSYQLELAREATFTDLVLNTAVLEREYLLPESLEAGEEYFWRVSAFNRCGERISQTSTFTIENTNSTINPLSIPVEVFPNPTAEVLHVSFSSNAVVSNVTISLSTIRGKQLLEESRDSQSGLISLDVSELPAGIYILSIQMGDESQYSRIVIQ